MERVLQECERVAADFSADPVHDLRVALRRCRSMADGLIAIDPDPDWKAMKKAGKRLFQRLGELRDIQIMIEWLEKLGPVTASVIEHESSVSHGTRSNAAQAAEQDSATAPETITGDEQSESHDPNQPDPAMHALLEILKNREAVQKHEAQAALEEFDGKQWRQWSKSLPLRAAHIRPGSAVFKHLALERWTAARELHARAMRNRSQIALHTLRI